MIHYTCDMCRREMSPDALRYAVKVDVSMAQDPLESTNDDSDTDHLEELTEIIEQIDRALAIHDQQTSDSLISHELDCVIY